MKKTALITGATSGLGLSYAKRYASEGYDLIITGRRTEIINKRAEEISKNYGCSVKVIIVDLSDETGLKKLLYSIKDRDIDVLINNAGFGLKGTFIDTDISDIKRLLFLQTAAVTELTYFVLQNMKKRNCGTIINISSDGAFMVIPRNVLYSSTKLYILNLTEGLHMELKNTNIHVQAVCPGLIDSDFHESAGMKVDKSKKGIFSFRKPDDIVQDAMNDLKQGKVISIPDKGARIIKAFAKYAPRKFFYKKALEFSISTCRDPKTKAELM